MNILGHLVKIAPANGSYIVKGASVTNRGFELERNPLIP
jgi:hypothetical protein